MSNSQTYRNFIERAYNRGDPSAADDFVSPQYREHQYPVPDITGVEVVRKDIVDTVAAVKNLKLTIEDLVEEGDKLWSRIEGTGTDPQTGKVIRFAVMDVCRFRDGKMIEHWGVPDRFAMLHQTGRLG